MHDRLNTTDELLEFDDFPLIEGKDLYVRQQSANQKSFKNSSLWSRISNSTKRFLLSSSFAVVVIAAAAVGAVLVLIQVGSFLAPADSSMEDKGAVSLALNASDSTVSESSIAITDTLDDEPSNCLNPVSAFGGITSYFKQFEPSDCVYSPQIDAFVVASDTGTLAAIGANGTLLRKFKIGKKYDLEAVATVSSRPNYVYVGIERPPMIVEFNIVNGTRERRWDLADLLSKHADAGDANSGLESLAYLPSKENSTEGFFYAGMQSNGHVLVLNLALDEAAPTFDFIGIITLPQSAPRNDLAAMTVVNDAVYFLYDLPQTLLSVSSDTIMRATLELVRQRSLLVENVTLSTLNPSEKNVNASALNETALLSDTLPANGSDKAFAPLAPLNVSSVQSNLTETVASEADNATEIPAAKDVNFTKVSNATFNSSGAAVRPVVVYNSSLEAINATAASLNSVTTLSNASVSVFNVTSAAQDGSDLAVSGTASDSNSTVTGVESQVSSATPTSSVGASVPTADLTAEEHGAVNASVYSTLGNSSSSFRLEKRWTSDASFSAVEPEDDLENVNVVRPSKVDFVPPSVVLPVDAVQEVFKLPRQGYEGICFNTSEAKISPESASILLAIDGKGKKNVGLEFTTFKKLNSCKVSLAA